eukprot:10160883-Alexandrium_andersonii.AAC.1
MCIRDSPFALSPRPASPPSDVLHLHCPPARQAPPRALGRGLCLWHTRRVSGRASVSYTHLTLPTICSV